MRNVRVGRNAAFTIIELLVVISVISILSGMLFPVLSSIRERMLRTEAVNFIENAKLALEEHLHERGRYPLDDWDLANKKTPNTVSALDSCRSLVETFDGDGYEDGPKIQLVMKAAMFDPSDWEQVFNPMKPSDVSMIDPWGKPWRYRQNSSIGYKYGKKILRGEVKDPNVLNCIFNPGSYDIWSAGPDGIDGTEDDIGNW